MENISHQKARAMVSSLGWRKIQQGYEWYSRDMKWVVYSAGAFYRRRKVNERY